MLSPAGATLFPPPVTNKQHSWHNKEESKKGRPAIRISAATATACTSVPLTPPFFIVNWLSGGR